MRAFAVALLVGCLFGPLVPAASPGAAMLAVPFLGDRAPERPPLQRWVLTGDGAPLRYRLDDARVRIRAGKWRGRDENRREVVTLRDGAITRNGTVCATWAKQSHRRVQQGLAVRVRRDGRRVRAVTLTKNVLFGYQSVLNLLTWDTKRRGDPWRKVAQVDLAAVLLRPDGKLRALPWRVCLRVRQRHVAFKVWLPGRTSEPRWGDPVASRSARLPKAFVFRGRAGWYVGHVPARGTTVYRRLSPRGD